MKDTNTADEAPEQPEHEDVRYANDVVPRDRVWTAVLNYIKNNSDTETFTAKEIDTQHDRVLTQQLRAMDALGWLERINKDGYTYRITDKLEVLLSSR